MDRRTVLRVLGLSTTGALTGCAGPDDGSGASNGAITTTRSKDGMNDTERTTEPEERTTEREQVTDAGLVTVDGGESVAATVDRIRSDIEEGPLSLVTTVDHAANAASVDMELPPTTLLVFGNPEVGTPLMQSARSVAVDLPQKMLVWEDDGAVKVTYNDPRYLADRHEISGQDDRIETIGDALEKLATGGSDGGSPDGTETES